MANQFDGASGEINLGASLYNNPFTGGGTIMAWVHPFSSGEGTFGRIINKSNNTSTDIGYGIFMNNDTGLRFGAGAATTGGAWTTATGTIPFNVTSHVVVVYDSDSDANDPVIYINGVSVTVSQATAPVGAYVDDSALDLLIGNFSADNRTFDGWIADARGYDRELNAEEVLSIYTLQGVDAIHAGKQWHLPMVFTDGIGDAFRDVQTTTVTNVSTFDAATPTTVDGDLMFLLITVTGDSDPAPVVSNPGGEFTLIEQLQLPASPSRCRASIWRRTAGASEAADYNFTSDLPAGWTAIMCSYEVDTVTVDQFLAASADSSSPLCPSVVAGGDALVIRTWSSDDDETPVTEPPGTTLRAEIADTGFGNDVSAAHADEFLASGATGTALWTGVGVEEWLCWTVTFLNTPLPAPSVPDVQDVGPNATDGVPSGTLTSTPDELRHRKRRRAA